MYCHFLSLGLHSTLCTSTQVIIFATEHLLTINYKFSVYSDFLDLLKCYMYSSAMCSSRKFPKEEIFDTPPPCLEIELKLQTFLELFFSFETPSPPPTVEFPIPSIWWEDGYFLELHKLGFMQGSREA